MCIGIAASLCRIRQMNDTYLDLILWNTCGCRFAIGVFNLGEGAYRFVFGLDEMGITPESGKTFAPVEVWSGEKPSLDNGVFDVTVEAHGCRLYRCRVVDQTEK